MAQVCRFGHPFTLWSRPDSAEESFNPNLCCLYQSIAPSAIRPRLDCLQALGIKGYTLEVRNVLAPTTQSAIDWGNVSSWVAALVMSLVALVALFKEEIVKRWRRPILDLSLRVTPPDCYKTESRYLRPGPGDNVPIRGFGKWHVANCYYFRLWVDNHGKTRADEFKFSRQNSIT